MHMTATLSSVTAVRELVDTYLDTYFTRRIEHADTIHGDYGNLWRSMHQLFRSGGKRLRPYMLILGYEAFGGTDTTSVVPIAAAHELLHLSLLIHDDIIDRDTIRYGTANVSGQYLHAYAHLVPGTGNRRHYADSAALLGGDLLLSSAHQLILDSTLSDRLKLLAHRQLVDGVFEVAGGELIDTEAAFRTQPVDPIVIARYKTISYSFISPLLTGAHLAEAPEDALELLKIFAIALGTAFQLTDDLLGVFGDEGTTGKSASGDLREGKRTLLIAHSLEILTGEDRMYFTSVLGNPDASPADIDRLRGLIVGCGARTAVEAQRAHFVAKARIALKQLGLSADATTEFEQLITATTERSS